MDAYIKDKVDVGGGGNSEIYSQIGDAINDLYLKIDEIGISHVVKNILWENGIREEWDKPVYNKMFQRGMNIAEKTLKERRRNEKVLQRFLNAKILQ